MGTTALLRKLESIADPSPAEKQALANLPGSVKLFGAREDVVREGDRQSVVCLLVEGFLCRYTTVPTGKRQIMAFHIPGEIPDLQGLFLDEMDHNIGTLVPSTIAMIPHDAMRALIESQPRIAHMLWRDTLIDAAVFRKWLTGVGRRSAYSRIAHMLCELVLRMKAVGLSDGKTCKLPLTQNEVGDALGLSTVHVNRTVQELRAVRLISWHNHSLTIHDWEGLQQAGEFDPAYLQLQRSA